MKNQYFLGIDVGSVSTNLVIINKNGDIIKKCYIRTQGNPIKAIQTGIKVITDNLQELYNIAGVGTTGSGRMLAKAIVGADVVKNEITAHAVAALSFNPKVRTVLEIGGQDSKIILIRNGIVIDFAMNTVCAAGTGSFLDRQASRLNIPIEDFGKIALKSKKPTRIAGRCAVFAESDMIHKQQMGHKTEDILAGLCEALVRNYLNNVGKGKEILPPILFQGGVAANAGIKNAFEKFLNLNITIPDNYDVMGALGAAILAKEKAKEKRRSNFFGFELSQKKYDASSFDCKGCANCCEIVRISANNNVIACWGDRCGKWSNDFKTSREASNS